MLSKTASDTVQKLREMIDLLKVQLRESLSNLLLKGWSNNYFRDDVK